MMAYLYTAVVGVIAHPLDRLSKLKYSTTRRRPALRRVALGRYRRNRTVWGGTLFAMDY